MGQTLRKMKKRSKKKKQDCDEAEDFAESSTSSWVSTLPSRYSTMSCPTEDSSTCSTTHNTTTERSGATQSRSAEPATQTSSAALPASSDVTEDANDTKKQQASSAPPPTQTQMTSNPFPPSSTGDYVSYTTSTSGTCRSSNTSADYSELQSIGYSSQPGEVHMYESDFEWIEAVEGFLTEEVINRSVVSSRRPSFALRGKKPTVFAQNYRSLYRNLLNKKGAGK